MYGETVPESLNRNTFDKKLPEENTSMLELYEGKNSGFSIS